MTALRKRMIHELQLHRKSPRTIEAYVTAVAQLSEYYGRPPNRISIEDVRDFFIISSPSGSTPSAPVIRS